MLLTCLQRESSESSVTPRFLMLSAGDMSHPVTDTLAMFPTECSFVLVPMKRTSDFDGLSARPLFVNQSRTARLHLSRMSSDSKMDFGSMPI